MLLNSVGLLVLSAAAVQSAAIGDKAVKRNPQRILPNPGVPSFRPGPGGSVRPGLPTPPPGTAMPDECWVYTVIPGDTCWALSQAYGTTIDSILFWNRISNPDCPIEVNQELVLCR